MTKSPSHEEIKALLVHYASAFNTAFDSHRRFSLNASEEILRGERVSLYSGTPDAWIAALHITYDATQQKLTHTLALTGQPLPPRMRERLSAAATSFETILNESRAHKP